jgi:hypothetical protein
VEGIVTFEEFEPLDPEPLLLELDPELLLLELELLLGPELPLVEPELPPVHVQTVGIITHSPFTR